MNKISVGVRSSGRGSNSIEITGLTQQEADQLLSAVRGRSWFTVEGDRLKISPRHLPLPDPVHDEKMIPFWRQHSNGPAQAEMVPRVFSEMSPGVIEYAHITIQSLCGYDYTPENYIRESEKLLSYGFIQVRSKRGEDGGFWEMWYLPGVWCAKGDLKEVVDRITNMGKSWVDPQGKRKNKECFDAILGFLRLHVSFGTLDISVQRMCQVAD